MSKELNTTWTTSFTVMTQDTNYHFPLIFGGLFFSKIDLCAAQTVTRFLYASDKCEGAVTHKADVSFLKPTYSGDLIVLTGKITSTGKKSVVVEVEARRENHFHQEPDLVARQHWFLSPLKVSATLKVSLTFSLMQSMDCKTE